MTVSQAYVPKTSCNDEMMLDITSVLKKMLRFLYTQTMQWGFINFYQIASCIPFILFLSLHVTIWGL